jgi:hypothetical protein
MARKLTLYHFTTPTNLQHILENGIYPFAKEDHEHMLPGCVAVWLTTDPHGNEINERHLAYWNKNGWFDLIAQHEAGRRYNFGYNDDGSVRLAVHLRGNFQGLCPYLELMAANYKYTAPKALARVAALPGASDWWVVVSPLLGETFIGIDPGAIKEISLISEPTPASMAIFKQMGFPIPDQPA